jgi:hypothetical protein
MRPLMIFGWLALPVLGAAYHFGPGQNGLKSDAAAAALASAQNAVEVADYEAAVEAYAAALQSLPADREPEARRIRIERAKAQMLAHQLPEAVMELDSLVAELQADRAAEPKLVDDARLAQANAQYYLTWLMKLEGYGREEWEPEIEGARQTFKLLAENAAKSGQAAEAVARAEDVESAIRLARMSPGDLQGLAIPKQCQGCCSGSCKKKGRSMKQSKNTPKDARGASSGPPPDGSGS